MELSHCADIIQGNIPTRIETKNGITIESITMQELNYLTNVSDDIPVSKFLIVQRNKIETFCFTQKNDVVIGLNSGKAIVIDESHINKLVLSNMAVIRIKDIQKVDPYYLCWFLNRNLPLIKKMQQGTYAVAIIPLSTLKSFQISLISIQKQFLFGKIFELKRKRDRLIKIIEQKKTLILSQQLVKIYDKESKHGSK